MTYPPQPPPGPQHPGPPQFGGPPPPWQQPPGYGYPVMRPPVRSKAGRTVAIVLIVVALLCGGLATGAWWIASGQYSNATSNRLALYHKLGAPEGFAAKEPKTSKYDLTADYELDCAATCPVDPAVKATTFLTTIGARDVKADEVAKCYKMESMYCTTYHWVRDGFNLSGRVLLWPNGSSGNAYLVTVEIESAD